MNESRDKRGLLELWDRVQSGRASEVELEALDARLAGDERARRWVAEAAWLEAELRFSGESLVAGGGVDAGDGARAAAGFELRWSHAAVAAVAAVITWGAWTLVKAEPAVATLVKAKSCKWGNSALPTLEGSRLPKGTLELVEGMATLTFESGAEVVLEAPVTVELLSKMECRIERGTVVAEVPERAKGFTVYTAETTVVDYGTRFGVSAGEDGKCLVHVIDGRVEVERRGEEGVKQLRKGDRVDYGGVVKSQLHPVADADAEPDRGPVQPLWAEADGWHTLTTAYGRGQDSWIQQNPNTVIAGDEGYLRAKFSSFDRGLQRKVYVAFDLSALPGPFEEAELSLQVEPSELGYGSLVPDATFSVYGVTDEAQDQWSERELTWGRAPAHRDEEAFDRRPVPEQSRWLGQFVVAQGVQSGAVTIGGAELTAFLNEDSNQLVTLVVCRETDELAKSGLVHAFASKENPGSSPPRLRVKVAAEP